MAPMPGEREHDTSITLLERLQNNPSDPLAWSLFVERYHPMIRAWCLQWRLQDSDADDVVQDVLVKLLAAIRKFQYDPAQSFRAWLKTVTQHALSDFVRSRRNDPGQMPSPVELIAESPDARTDLENRIENAYDAELLELAIDRVKQRVKPATFQAFHLTVVEGGSGAGAAQKLQIPVAHVFVNKHRVQKMIQEEVRILRKRRK
jgi:RNA polymerase sigma-70 factor (ECF subfamily)